MAMKKKAAAPEPAGESAPMWIVSFADLVTLLMSFFVVLYAMKQDGKEAQMQTTAAIKATFGYEPPPDSDTELDQMVRAFKGKPGPPYPNAGGKSTKTIQGADGSNPEVESIRAGKDIVTGGKITFAVGETRLDETSVETIHQIADKVKGFNNVLMIKGHVSADEVALRPDDPNGMGLSYRRATEVADELVKLGIDRKVLRPVACGPFEPLKTGVYDAKGLRQNRRVEIFTTDYTASDYFPMRTVQAAGTQSAAETKSSETSKPGEEPSK